MVYTTFGNLLQKSNNLSFTESPPGSGTSAPDIVGLWPGKKRAKHSDQLPKECLYGARLQLLHVITFYDGCPTGAD